MNDIFKGIFGTATSGAGYYIGTYAQVRESLQFASLIIGIIVGVLTGISLTLSIVRKLKEKDDE